MLIENPDAFKTWLTSILEPLCDADPAALAKYVYALVKKDKPLEELRDGMLDQLDVFLQHETKPFVELLFKSLETNEYLSPAALTQATTIDHQESITNGVSPPEEASSEVSNNTEEPRGGAATHEKSPPPSAAPKHRVVLNRGAPPVKHATAAPRPQYDQTLTKVLPLTELLEEPLDNPPRRRDRRADSLKDKDERRRKRSRSRSWERNRRGPRRHGAMWRNTSPQREVRYEKRRPLSRSPSPVPRGRYRNRSPPPPPSIGRISHSRSRSPQAIEGAARPRERVRSRERELERDRASRDREHRDKASRERERDRERDRSRDRSRGTPTQDSEPASYHAAPKRRCIDFYEKGYCTRGDFCQWDHGVDPVVLEDTALNGVLAIAPPVPEYNPLAPDIWSRAPPPPLPGFPPYPPHHGPPRELVPIPRIRGPVGAPARPPAMPPQHPQHRPHMHHHQQKKPFDFNRVGGRPTGNCTLEVKKVPPGINNITHLNNHFGKFGRIVNIQVCHEGDPEAALITFSSHPEANVAYKSTEAVLNNRFIKVFWHNPESKQENVPPTGTNPPGNKTTASERAAPHVNPPSHAGSHNKVLINKDNMKATADSKVAAASAAAEKLKAEEVKTEETAKPDKQKQVADMRRRAYTLLQTQLTQQKLLIEKLEKGDVTGPQRSALMEAIKTAQDGIEKLQKELLTYPKAVQTAQAGAVVKKLKSREEAQKELLDMELDLFTKQQEGQDVTELLKKVAELRKQTMMMSYPQTSHPATRRSISRGASRFGGNTRYSLRAGNFNSFSSTSLSKQSSVDHRPRALLVSGFEADEADAVVQHFAQYGEIVSRQLDASVPELVLQYRVRAHAERAHARAKHYNERTLTVTWTTSPKPTSSAAVPRAVQPPPGEHDAEPAPPGAASPQYQPGGKQEAPEDISEEALLQDDEDEDEREERSWRR